MADTFLISAVALYKATHFTGYSSGENIIAIDVAEIGAFTPRAAYIKRYLVPGQNQVQYLLDFAPSSADLLDANILQGIYVEQNGMGVVVDCISVADFIATANGSQAALTRRYGSGIPAFTTPTPTTYYVRRLDDATGSAHNIVVTDYVTQYVGSVKFVSHVTGTSIYTFDSYTVPVAIKGDVISTTP